MPETIYETIKDSDGVECLIKRGNLVRCKNCAYAFFNKGLVQQGHIVCKKPFTERWQAVKPDDWFCADGERVEKTNYSEYPNGS